MPLSGEIGEPSPSAVTLMENPNGSPPEASADAFAGKKKKKTKVSLNIKFSDKYHHTGVVLGEGASSRVLECRDLRHGNMYAVKSVSKTTPGFNRERVLAEIGILAKCKGQETIIQMMEYFEDEASFTLVFEKVDGGPLMTRIKESAMFTEYDASRVIGDVAHALAFLHSIGIAHRDIKPDNILCVLKDRISPVKLVDFNLSHRHDVASPPRIRSPVGTPEFMSPEVAMTLHGDQQSYDELCDVWSLGIILHMMLVGFMPFVGDCGMDCGWKQGSPCELCAEDLLENISQCKLISFDAPEWQLVTGGAKDLISRMLVRASQRISARHILEHPWICQTPPMTPLATPGRITEGVDAGFNTFLADANDKMRKMEPDTAAVSLGAPSNALYRRRLRSQALLAPFATVRGRDLSEIHTPRAPLVSPPDAGLPRSRLSESLSVDDLHINA